MSSGAEIPGSPDRGRVDVRGADATSARRPARRRAVTPRRAAPSARRRGARAPRGRARGRRRRGPLELRDARAAPTTGITGTSPPSSHASATWFGVAPISAATSCSTRTRSRVVGWSTPPPQRLVVARERALVQRRVRRHGERRPAVDAAGGRRSRAARASRQFVRPGCGARVDVAVLCCTTPYGATPCRSGLLARLDDAPQRDVRDARDADDRPRRCSLPNAPTVSASGGLAVVDVPVQHVEVVDAEVAQALARLARDDLGASPW